LTHSTVINIRPFQQKRMSIRLHLNSVYDTINKPDKYYAVEYGTDKLFTHYTGRKSMREINGYAEASNIGKRRSNRLYNILTWYKNAADKVIYYNSLIDNWYDLVAWMCTRSEFETLYIRPGKSVLIQIKKHFGTSYIKMIPDKISYAELSFGAFTNKNFYKIPMNSFCMLLCGCYGGSRSKRDEVESTKKEEKLLKKYYMYSGRITAANIRRELTAKINITKKMPGDICIVTQN